MKSNKKNTIILFGAGAAIPWGGPTTNDLTEMIINTGFKTVNGDKYITEFIYEELLLNGFKEDQINFETVINIIEELIVYNAHFDWQKKIPGHLQGFLDLKHTQTLYNYSFRNKYTGHGYRLNIPADQEYDFGKFSYHNENPNQFFLQHLLSGILTCICERVGKYAWHTKSSSKIDFNATHSKNFVNWISRISRNSVPRLYTLNYDRIFKVLLEKAGIKVFEGFDCDEIIDYSEQLRANVPRILTDFDHPIHYNLHGSAFWMAEALDAHQLPNPELFLKATPDYPMNHDFPFTQLEKGKTIMVTNLVAGYQKAQRSLITPLKQMQAAFDRDCCSADEIFIVGYSLGDEHINESIKMAMRFNPNLKLTIIDPSFADKNIDNIFQQKISPFRQTGNQIPNTIYPGITHTFYNGIVMIHTIPFEKYLEWQANPMKRYLVQRPTIQK